MIAASPSRGMLERSERVLESAAAMSVGHEKSHGSEGEQGHVDDAHEHDHEGHAAEGHDHDHEAHEHQAHDHEAHEHEGEGRGSHGAHHHHGHHHGHHHHDVATKGRAFAIGVGLNVLFVAVETIYGLSANSVALLADAAHNLSDVLGLLMAWAALRLATRKPSPTHTYGMRRATVLAALVNAVLLVAAVGGVAWEAIGRLGAPEPVPGTTLIGVAALGVVVNGTSALFFLRDRSHDANIRGAFLHLAADAAVSLGVVVTGIAILKTGIAWLDPAASLAVSVVILWGTWGLLKEATNLLLDAVPAHVDLAKVRSYLESLPEVVEVHDLHVWAMSTTEVAMTAHLVVPWCPTPPRFLAALGGDLKRRFRIDHSTVQLEPHDAGGRCDQAPDDVV
jgi:cobalt-zinc-cadmium efflux system protein